MLRYFFRRYCHEVAKKSLTIGDHASITKKITPEDLGKFMELSGDFNPVHTQQKPIAHGAYLNSLVSAVIGTKLPGPGTLVVKQTLNFPNKCYVHDIVTVTVRIVDVRKIVKVSFTCEVQEGNKTVLFGDAHLVFNQAQ